MEFIVDNIKVTKNNDDSYSLSSLYADNSSFVENSVLATIASKLLDEEKFKNSIVFYDGCMMYNSKNK